MFSDGASPNGMGCNETFTDDDIHDKKHNQSFADRQRVILASTQVCITDK